MNIDSEYRKKHQSTKNNIIDSLARLVAKITLKYSSAHQEFIESYKRQLINVCKQQHPEYSMVELSARTGIDRRYIKIHLQSENLTNKPSKIKQIIEELRQVSKSNDSTFIIKTGGINSFEDICNKVTPGSLTYSAIAKELIRQGNILEKEDGYEIVDLRYTPESHDLEEHFRLLIKEMNRITDTIIYNVDSDGRNNKQFQRNIFSTQIPVTKINQAKLEITNILSQALLNVSNVIEVYEEETPSGTYPAFGASIFMFGCEVQEQLNKQK